MIFDSLQPNPHYPQVGDVDPEEIFQKRSLVRLIDVRTPEEFDGELGHIPGALLVPMNFLEKNLEAIPREAGVVFVCRSGRRSAKAAALAKKIGYSNAVNMKGGMIRWHELQMDVEYGDG